jgi:hypothetical protein
LLFALAFPVIGAVIATRRPENPIGWIFVAVGVSFAAATLSSEYASYALITRRGAIPFGGFAAWVSTWAWPPGIVLTFTFLLLLSPPGRCPRGGGGRLPGWPGRRSASRWSRSRSPAGRSGVRCW